MVKSWRNSATCSWEWFRRSSKIGGCFVMGIVIRLLRHIPAYLLLTYTDERNPKMFHGLRRFVLSEKTNWPARRSRLCGHSGGLSFAGSRGSGGAAEEQNPGVAKAWNWCLENAGYLRLHSPFRVSRLPAFWCKRVSISIGTCAARAPLRWRRADPSREGCLK